MEAVNESTLGPIPVPKPRWTWWRKALRGLLVLLLALALAAAVAHVAFKYSGDGQWEYLTERKGVTVYARKVPGKTLKEFRAVFRVNATLSSIISFMQDDESDLDVDFYAVKVIELINPQDKISYFRSGFPKPIQDRDFVVRHTFAQEPATKAINYVLRAVPDRIPVESCCIRVPRMDNNWRFTPLKNHDVEIDWVIDMDVGGLMPYFMINQAHPEIMVDFGSSLQAIFRRPKYVNAKLDWITEPTD